MVVFKKKLPVPRNKPRAWKEHSYSLPPTAEVSIALNSFQAASRLPLYIHLTTLVLLLLCQFYKIQTGLHKWFAIV
jgi:hypothetical protein